MPRISVDEIGTPGYSELLSKEAEFWDMASRGETDYGVSIWKMPGVWEALHEDAISKVITMAARRRRVLDLGCGEAYYTIELARRGCVVDSVDIAMGRLIQAAKRADALCQQESWSGQARFFRGDLNRLGTAPERYDAVLAASVLHHVLDVDGLLDQVYRSLKPGGVLICLDHMEASALGRLLRYALLLLLPTEVPYRSKPRHAFNRLMARIFPRILPSTRIPNAFTLPERSPFEEVTGHEAVASIEKRFKVECYSTRMAFADIVAAHLTMRTVDRQVATTRWLRRLDDWLVEHRVIRGDSYFLVAHRPFEK